MQLQAVTRVQDIDLIEAQVSHVRNNGMSKVSSDARVLRFMELLSGTHVPSIR